MSCIWRKGVGNPGRPWPPTTTSAQGSKTKTKTLTHTGRGGWRHSSRPTKRTKCATSIIPIAHAYEPLPDSRLYQYIYTGIIKLLLVPCSSCVPGKTTEKSSVLSRVSAQHGIEKRAAITEEYQYYPPLVKNRRMGSFSLSPEPLVKMFSGVGTSTRIKK